MFYIIFWKRLRCVFCLSIYLFTYSLIFCIWTSSFSSIPYQKDYPFFVENLSRTKWLYLHWYFWPLYSISPMYLFYAIVCILLQHFSKYWKLASDRQFGCSSAFVLAILCHCLLGLNFRSNLSMFMVKCVWVLIGITLHP